MVQCKEKSVSDLLQCVGARDSSQRTGFFPFLIQPRKCLLPTNTKRSTTILLLGCHRMQTNTEQSLSWVSEATAEMGEAMNSPAPSPARRGVATLQQGLRRLQVLLAWLLLNEHSLRSR